MSFHGNIPERIKNKLRGHAASSKGDRDKFKQLVLDDKSLKSLKWQWYRFDNLARRLELYDEALPSSKSYPFIQLGDELLEGLMKLLADDSVSYNEVRSRDSAYSKFTNNQFRYFAQHRGIKIHKGRGQKLARDGNRLCDDKLRSMIESGSFNKGGIGTVFDTMKREFPAYTKGLTKKTLTKQVDAIIWTKSKLDELKDAIKHGISPETFAEYNPHIPLKLIQVRTRWLRGVVSVDQFAAESTLIKGIGRLSVEGTTKRDEMFSFPESCLSKPYAISAGNRWRFFVINGANFGTVYNPLIEENPLRLALAHVERKGADAVFITNLLNVEFKKAVGSELHVLKAFVAGQNINPNILSPAYSEDAKRILKESPDNEVIYEKAAELVINMMWGLRKVSHKPVESGKFEDPKDWVAEYSGKVYIVFGHNEESLIASVAYWELNFITNLRKKMVETERKLVKIAIKRIEQGLPIEGGAPALVKGQSSLKTLQQFRDKDKELEDAIGRYRVTLISSEDRRRFTNRLRSIVVRKIEESIPNSKVIGQGSVNVKVGDKVIQLNIPGHMRVTGGLLDSYVKQYGALSRRQAAPDAVIICHPYSLNYRMAVREINVDNNRAEAKIYTAPIIVDGDFLRNKLAKEGLVRSSHPIAKVVLNTNFSPGILQATYINGIFNAEPVRLEALMKEAIVKRSKKTFNKYADKYIWIYVETDPHFGSRNRVEAWSKATNGSLGVSDAVIQMMRDGELCQNGKLPVHITTTNDDQVQANHYETHKQPHPNQMSYQDKEALIKSMKPEDAVKFLLDQDRLRGVDWLQDQIKQVKERHIKPNVDFYGAVLQRVLNSGLVITPSSKIHNMAFDSRDLGAINKGTGNHIESEINRSLTEGFIYRDYLRGLLYGRHKGMSDEFIDRMVAAPLEGNQYFAWGYVGMPGEYEWAIEFRSDPPRLSSWADVLNATANNDSLRGDYGLFMTGHHTVKIYGDKHFFAAIDTEDIFYHMCASGTSTDLYGHRGFPPNNTGISFVGLPVGGPSAGPILVRPIHVQHILRYFDKPFDFDWEAFLPNPV